MCSHAKITLLLHSSTLISPSHAERRELFELRRPDELVLRDVHSSFLGNLTRRVPSRRPQPPLALIDHCRFRYLLSVPGIGYSNRLKALLACGAAVIHVVAPWEEFYMPAVKLTTCTLRLNAEQTSDQASGQAKPRFSATLPVSSPPSFPTFSASFAASFASSSSTRFLS